MKIQKIEAKDPKDFYIMFECPGCKQNHGINQGWQFNGDFERPTINPSILVRGTSLTNKGLEDLEAWEKEGYPSRNGEPFESVPTICHSFVKDGKIQFLNDCTHELAGQTVELEDID